jgi:hypothetical protein
MSYTPLSSSTHKNLRLIRGTFFHLQNKPYVPISVLEASRAALDLPLAFARTRQGLSVVAILSLDKEDNAHVGPKGLWMGGYIPVVVRAHPFSMYIEQGKAVLLVDTESDWLSEDEGDLLFDAEGNPNTALQNKIDLLKNKAPNPHRDQPVLEAIAKSGVLESWEDVLSGLYRINREKLYSLDDQTFLGLRNQKALDVIFAQLASLPRINRLNNLAQRKQKMRERLGQQQVSEEDILSSFEDDDILRFDNE